MESDRFEWDDAKAAQSEAKHGVSFEYAVSVFDDVHGLEFADIRRDYGEARRKFIGYTPEGLCLVVIFTERGDHIRLISARRASRRERSDYAAAK
jgi:uncharacterized DUF497 family protein